ncbi:unnamed protein product [Nyctereutes procyonoides]|uniref:(raccoon dog) hypothetical protein n=1 Tax=Nyctereutes procyonoides TaxID=34880 RepID=A0A811Y8K4_NYCPR|nr:unnamed protein product [Nyctereutes procyonoides]
MSFTCGKYTYHTPTFTKVLTIPVSTLSTKYSKNVIISKITLYEVHVATGMLWNAGTIASVYISVYGEKGDSGSRQLFRSKNSFNFLRGQTDTFALEAVHLGDLYKIVVGHDGLGPGNGWFLDDVVIKDPTTNHEYTFFCHRWLDQGEDDGKIVRELYARDNSIVFARLFDVIFNKGNICIFQSHEMRHLSLAVDNSTVSGMASGGDCTELRVLCQPNRCALLESALVPGHIVTFDRHGKVADESSAGYADLSKEFVVFVKGVFLNSAEILLATSLCQALCLQPDGSCTGVGSQSEKSYWKVHKISSGICMFESVKNARMYLRIKDGQCDGTGIGDTDCHFKIKKNLENASISLESVKSPGLFVGLQPDGQTKPVIYTKDGNVFFYPQVIKFGRENPMGMSATPSQQEEKIHESKNQQETLLESSVAKEIRPSRSSKNLLSEDVWKVLLLTGNTGTQANVEIKIIGKIYKIRLGLASSQSGAYRGDVVCELPVVQEGQAIFSLVRSHVDVHTGQLKRAETESEVSLCLCGERGDTGLRLLDKSNMPVKFQRGQNQTYISSGSSALSSALGKLQKVLLRCEASDESQYWYCEKVVLREPGTASESVFTCERWLPFMSQGIIHSEIELYLQEMQINCQPKIQEEANEGDWKVTVVTGDLENAGTTATVSLYVYGEATYLGPIILGSGKYQLFNSNSADIFKINLKDTGEIYKVRIGHDNNIRLENIDTYESFCLTVDFWISENGSRDLWKEMPIVRTNKAPLPVVVYDICMYTGTKPGAETEANILINLIGTKGDSGNQKLHQSKNNKVKFRHGQSIVVKSKEEDGNQEVLFPCNRWLDEYQDDGRTEQELFAESSYHAGETESVAS